MGDESLLADFDAQECCLEPVSVAYSKMSMTIYTAAWDVYSGRSRIVSNVSPNAHYIFGRSNSPTNAILSVERESHLATNLLTHASEAGFLPSTGDRNGQEYQGSHRVLSDLAEHHLLLTLEQLMPRLE